VERSAITFFSWAALGYSFKFVWAPLVDQLPLPVLSRALGRRRGWLLLAQLMVIVSITAMALVDPSQGQQALTCMALAAVALGFSSATQDIVIDAYRIEVAQSREQSLLSATYIAGYRIAMVISGAGALYLATWLGDDTAYDYAAWRYTYLAMAGVMVLGVVTTLCVREPKASEQRNYDYHAGDYGRFLGLFVLVVLAFIAAFSAGSSALSDIKASFSDGLSPVVKFLLEVTRLLVALLVAGIVAWCLVRLGVANKKMVNGTYIAPVKDFFSRYGVKMAVLLLLLVGTYRVSDIVLGIISNVFYLDIGFSKTQIASAVKTFGLFMVILGGFVGGIFSLKFGVVRMLLWGAIL
ncbi:MAG: MFS transporter, partial [Pontibacterium sp.]